MGIVKGSALADGVVVVIDPGVLGCRLLGVQCHSTERHEVNVFGPTGMCHQMAQ